MSSFPRNEESNKSSSDSTGRDTLSISIRDVAPRMDEFVRKQRVIRYMEEERERAKRTQILRQEHENWVLLRSNERSARLQYMTEEEIAVLLKREAEEMERERNFSLSQERQLPSNKCSPESAKLSSESREKSENSVKRSISSPSEAERTNSWIKLLEEKDELIRKLRIENNVKLQREKDLERKNIEYEHLVQQAREEKTKFMEAKLKCDVLEELNHDLNLKLSSKENSTEELNRLVNELKAESEKMQEEVRGLKKVLVEKDEMAKEVEENCRVKALNAQSKDEEVQKANNLAKELQHILDAVREENKRLNERLADFKKQHEEESCRLKQIGEEYQALARNNKELLESLRKSKTEAEALSKSEKQKLLDQILSLDELLLNSNSEKELYKSENKKLYSEIEQAKREVKQNAFAINDFTELTSKKEQMEEEISALRKENIIEKKKVTNLTRDNRKMHSQIQEEEASRKKFEDLATQAVNANQERFLELTKQCEKEVEKVKKQLEKSEKESQHALNDQEATIKELKDHCKGLRMKINEIHGVKNVSHASSDPQRVEIIDHFEHPLLDIGSPWLAKMQALEKKNRLLINQILFYSKGLEDAKKNLQIIKKKELKSVLERKNDSEVKVNAEREKENEKSFHSKRSQNSIPKHEAKKKASNRCC